MNPDDNNNNLGGTGTPDPDTPTTDTPATDSTSPSTDFTTPSATPEETSAAPNPFADPTTPETPTVPDSSTDSTPLTTPEPAASFTDTPPPDVSTPETPATDITSPETSPIDVTTPEAPVDVTTPETPADPATTEPAAETSADPAAPVPGSIGSFTGTPSFTAEDGATPAAAFPATAPPKKSRTGTIVLIVIALVVLIGGGFLTWFLVNQANEKEDELTNEPETPVVETVNTTLTCTRKLTAAELANEDELELSATSIEVVADFTDYELDEILNFTTYTFTDEDTATSGMTTLKADALASLSPTFVQDGNIVTSTTVATYDQLTTSIATNVFDLTVASGKTLDTTLDGIEENYTDNGYTCTEE